MIFVSAPKIVKSLSELLKVAYYITDGRVIIYADDRIVIVTADNLHRYVMILLHDAREII